MVKLTGTIFRKFHKNEGDVIDISQETADERFRAMLAKKKTEYDVAHKPFCKKCALNDFNDAKKNLGMELDRKRSGVNEDFVSNVDGGDQFNNITFQLPDLDMYGADDHFKLVHKVEKKEPDRLNAKIMTVAGFDFDYLCKKYGYGNTVHVPIDIYNKKEADGTLYEIDPTVVKTSKKILDK